MGFMNDFKRWVSGEVDDDDDFDMEQEEYEAAAEPANDPYQSSQESARSAYSHAEASRASQARQAPSNYSDSAMTRTNPNNNRVVSINATTKLAVVLVKADQFNSVADIADHLKNKMTVVLNLETTDKEVSKRMLDFLSGVTYAIEGKIKRVSTGTYLITPLDVEIVGDDIISELENSGMRF